MISAAEAAKLTKEDSNLDFVNDLVKTAAKNGFESISVEGLTASDQEKLKKLGYNVRWWDVKKRFVISWKKR